MRTPSAVGANREADLEEGHGTPPGDSSRADMGV